MTIHPFKYQLTPPLSVKVRNMHINAAAASLEQGVFLSDFNNMVVLLSKPHDKMKKYNSQK